MPKGIDSALYSGSPFSANSAASPMGVAPIGQFSSTGNNTSPFDDSYPNSDVGVTSPMNDPWTASQMEISRLMPSSWKAGSNGKCGDLSKDNTEWAKWSPSKAQFSNFVTASGSSRVPLSSRNGGPGSAKLGEPNLLRSATAVPLSGQQVLFGDSSARVDQIFNATGIMPTTATC